MAEGEPIEMRDRSGRVEETSNPPIVTQETEIDLPDVPLDVGEAKVELIKQNFVADVRKGLRIRGEVESQCVQRLNI